MLPCFASSGLAFPLLQQQPSTVPVPLDKRVLIRIVVSRVDFQGVVEGLDGVPE